MGLLMKEHPGGPIDRRTAVDYTMRFQLSSYFILGMIIGELQNKRKAVGSCVDLSVLHSSFGGCNKIITSAHNLATWSSFLERLVSHKEAKAYIARQGQIWAELKHLEGWRIHPKYDGSSFAFDIAVVDKWTNKEDKDSIGFQPNQRIVNDVSFGPVKPSDLHIGMAVEVAGFPGVKNGFAYTCRGEIKDVKQDSSGGWIIYHNCDTTSGQAGSPIMLTGGAKKLIIGLHLSFDEIVNLNTGMLITYPIYKWILGTNEESKVVEEHQHNKDKAGSLGKAAYEGKLSLLEMKLLHKDKEIIQLREEINMWKNGGELRNSDLLLELITRMNEQDNKIATVSIEAEEKLKNELSRREYVINERDRLVEMITNQGNSVEQTNNLIEELRNTNAKLQEIKKGVNSISQERNQNVKDRLQEDFERRFDTMVLSGKYSSSNLWEFITVEVKKNPDLDVKAAENSAKEFDENEFKRLVEQAGKSSTLEAVIETYRVKTWIDIKIAVERKNELQEMEACSYLEIASCLATAVTFFLLSVIISITTNLRGFWLNFITSSITAYFVTALDSCRDIRDLVEGLKRIDIELCSVPSKQSLQRGFFKGVSVGLSQILTQVLEMINPGMEDGICNERDDDLDGKEMHYEEVAAPI